MGVFTRPDSLFWWLYLETTREKEKTEILVGTTSTERRDSKQLAARFYHRRMTEIAIRVHRLPVALPASRFQGYAATYRTDVSAHRRGAEREGRILDTLVAFFGDDLLGKIDQDLVREYWKVRLAAKALPNTVNREVDLLKAMLRDAVPKYLDASPLVGMKRLPIVKNRKRLLRPEEEKRLLAVATDPQDYALIVLGIDTLIRMGDLLDLQRTDRDGLWLTVRDSKNGEPYDVPLSPRAVTALEAITHDRPYFLEKFRRAENPRDWRSAVGKRLKRLCAKASPPVPFGKLEHGITFHGATRKTGATRLLIDQRQPVTIVQQLGNWRTPDVLLEIYSEAQRGDLLAAVGQARTADRAAIPAPFPPKANTA